MAYLYLLLFSEVKFLKELGQYLKKTRINNGVSLEEASDDLEISSVELENIESGNVKAFKDVYNLREYVKQYAKYLGIDPDKVADEFNGFLFEHTSKISLDDIRAAQKKIQETEEKKIKSPYTIEHKEKINIWPFVIGLVILLLFSLLIYLIISSANKAPSRDTELMPVREESLYEFTY